MKRIYTSLFTLCASFFLFSTLKAAGQDEWPKVISSTDGSEIKIYELQPESFSGNTLKARAAISILQSGKTDPTFGTFWTVSTVETDKDNRRVILQSVKVPNIKFPGQVDDNMISSLKTTLETQLPQVIGDVSLDDLLASLDMNQEEKKLSKDLNTSPPKIIYTTRPSLLVMIDGEPKLQQNKEWNLDVVINSPFTIVKNNDGRFYLYGGKHWYSAPSATGPYNYTTNVPQNLQPVQTSVDNANSSNAGYTDSAAAVQENTISDIIVSTNPAELIQSNGQASFTPIDGTDLSYINNSSNDVFRLQSTGQYYVLISGRWYTSSSLNSNWKYIQSNSLPPDFAKIPEGSPKDNVLASVAGTDAAREAVMDAQIPQTAKVDRRTATTNPGYNGDPQFAPIKGTNLEYATNTSSSVLRYNGVYYSVDNGVWFQSDSPAGPWVVCTDRPDEVDRIPPSSPLYNTKYVYVYDVTPDYVYMGYTPGYLNTYIYGPTVVYGTGFYYDPWFSGYYYPRPWTWGFNMCYNPWAGWSLGYNYSYGWFNFGLGFGRSFGGYGYGGGGWWGPRIYRPPYAWNRSRQYGFYGNNFYRNRNVYVNNYNNNIYRNRPGVVTNNRDRGLNRNNNGNNFNRPNNNNNRMNPGYSGNNNNRNQNGFNNRPDRNTGTANGQPNRQLRPGGTTNNNVFSDRNGNVYQRNNQNNQWQQRDTRAWQNLNNNNSNNNNRQGQETIRNLDRQQQMRDRGQQRTENFERARSNPGGGGGFSRPSNNGGGGGSRPSSGGGGGSSRPSGGGNHGGGHHG
jgi:hypothetical protein